MQTTSRLLGRWVLALFLILATSMTFQYAQGSEESVKKAVLVTGASSGIGKLITVKLANEGFLVYAGARKDKDIATLNEIENVIAVRLDVTIQDDIDQAVKQVAVGGLGLYGVVNNAGVLSLGSMLGTEASELAFVFDVNVSGPYRITNAFAPMIIESKGRVVNISSISGILSSELAGIYSMSKHAVEAYTDSLDRELTRLGARAIAIEPGTYDSKIFNNLCDRMPASEKQAMDDRMRQIVDDCDDLPRGEGPNNRFPQPDRVADAVYQALTAIDPKEHYMVVPNQEEAKLTIAKAIEELISLNQDQEFSFTRAELVRMLDKEIESHTPTN